MTLHCSLIGGHNILEEHSPGLNFNLSSMKMGEACSYKSLCTPDRLCLRNTFNRHQPNFCLQCKLIMWSEVDTWFTAQKLTLWEVFLHGFRPTRTHARAHIHTYIQQIQLYNFFNFTPPDKQNNMWLIKEYVNPVN